MSKVISFIFILFISFSILNTSLVFAKCPDNPADCAGATQDSSTTTSGSVNLPDPLGGASGTSHKTVPGLIGQVISAVLGIVGSLALLMFIYGGFMWMLSGGNDKMVTKGKDTLIWATLGLVLIFLSYVLIHFIFKTLGV